MKVSDKTTLAPAHERFADSYGKYDFESMTPIEGEKNVTAENLRYRIASETKGRLLFNENICVFFFNGKWFSCKNQVKNLIKMRLRIRNHKNVAMNTTRVKRNTFALDYNQFNILNKNYKYND